MKILWLDWGQERMKAEALLLKILFTWEKGTISRFNK